MKNIQYVCFLIWLVGAGGFVQSAEARRRSGQHKFMVQILVQTPGRFSVPGVQVYANRELIGATDRFGIFIGWIKGRPGQSVEIQIQDIQLTTKKKRRFRLRMRTTNGTLRPEVLKARFFLRGARRIGHLKNFPIRVFALSPDRVGISKVKVLIDGKYVGRTNKYGLYVGTFRARPGEVIQVKALGRGKGNTATLPVRLRLHKKTKKPILVKFHAYIRP